MSNRSYGPNKTLNYSTESSVDEPFRTRAKELINSAIKMAKDDGYLQLSVEDYLETLIAKELEKLSKQ